MLDERIRSKLGVNRSVVTENCWDIATKPAVSFRGVDGDDHMNRGRRS